jgi:hypothetical protein
MKLYKAKVAGIAKEVIEVLVTDEDIEVVVDRREEAEKDLSAIMEEYLRREMGLRNRIRDHMSNMNIPYEQYGRTRGKVAEQSGHPLGDDVERFLARQFVEILMISPNIDDVFEEDNVMYKKIIDVLRGHHVDESAIRDEARDKVKNVKEGTVDYEIALQKAVKEVKVRKGLIKAPPKHT